MGDLRAWIPRNALLDSGSISNYSAIIDCWMHAWFSRECLHNVELGVGVGRGYGAEARTASWRSKHGDVEFGLTESASQYFCQHILDEDLPLGWQSSSDNLFLRELGTKCVDDFAEHLSERLGVQISKYDPLTYQGTTSTRSDQTFILSITTRNGGRILDIYLSEALLANERKRSISVAPPDAAPISRQEGIDAQVVSLGARIGAAEIDIKSLKALAPGDVIVLDQTVNSELSLTLNGESLPQAPCLLCKVSDTLTIHFKDGATGPENAHVEV